LDTLDFIKSKGKEVEIEILKGVMIPIRKLDNHNKKQFDSLNKK